MAAPIRIANCSGFYGDRLSAAREMVEGGPIDVLTGDYLAELTLMILHKDRAKDPRMGFARTRQTFAAFGFGAGTGGLTDKHEVKDVTITFPSPRCL